MLLLPSLRQLHERAPALAASRLAAGGGDRPGAALCGDCLGAQRLPGLFDFSTAYRSTALFWEMHVGGAALDGYLALAVPFAVHAVVRAPDRRRWGIAAALAVLVAYACLTSFSRSVYLGVGLSLALLAWRLSAQRQSFPADELAATSAPTDSPFPPPEAWRLWGGRVLLVVLAFEVVAVLGFGNFMSRRLSASERDLGGGAWSTGLPG
ncbi:hypothetical protein [Candidatus Accumulibacter sp. ACC007]|uniref:hypothetical protein n=1 Tax=Candidatus Accumulibacter sp. ACC007 TaxID=2823333 RepID=UPI0025C38CB4|nr:hypothetical protein [Candidatus Accumulibacter sp. ACC007]